MLIMEDLTPAWLEHIKTCSAPLIVYSPYITYSETLEVIKTKRCVVYTLFNFKDFLTGASSLEALELLVLAKCKVYWLKNLHAKIIISTGNFISLGSQNLTLRGATQNRELSALFQGKQYAAIRQSVESAVDNWVDSHSVRPITLADIRKMAALVDQGKQALDEFEQSIKSLEEKALRFEPKKKARTTLTSSQNAIREAIEKGDLSKTTHLGRVREYNGTTPLLKFDNGVNLLCWERQGRSERVVPGTRALCILDERHFGWVRLAGSQITRIALDMRLGFIMPNKRVVAHFSVEPGLIAQMPSRVNLVFVLTHGPYTLSYTPIQYLIDHMRVYRTKVAGGRLPRAIQELRTSNLEWISKNPEKLERLVSRKISETTPDKIGEKRRGVSASRFFGENGARIRVRLVFKGRRPILMAETE
jgi:hypothetical protein